jgi:putative phosphoesterase
LKIGVISDTHAASLTELPEMITTVLAGVDLIIHCGDFTSPAVLEELKRLGRVVAVHGNMDSRALQNTLPEREYLSIGGHRFGIAHGWGAPEGIEDRLRLFLTDVDIIVFGHSHLAQNRVINGIRFFNPGSARDSIGILNIDEKIAGEIIKVAR